MPRNDPAAAEQELRAAGARGKVPYPGLHKPWLSVDDACGREVAPNLGNVRRRGTACRQCTATNRGAARKRSVAGAAVALVEATGWEPLEPYPGAKQPWRVRHMACGLETARAFNTICSKGAMTARSREHPARKSRLAGNKHEAHRASGEDDDLARNAARAPLGAKSG